MKKIAFLLFAFLFAQNSFAQGQGPTCNPFPKTISVSGSAEMEIVPDEIFVQVDLKEYKKKGGDKIEIEQIKEAFLANCRAVGIPDSNISVMNFMGSNANLILKRRRKDPDLMATLSYQVKFNKASKIDDLVNRLDDEATGNFAVIRTSHSRMTEFRKQLKTNAVKAAKEKATYLCTAVDETLGQAITIEEPGEQFYGYNMAQSNTISQSRMAINDEAGGGLGSEIDFKKIKLRYEVKMVYAIK